MKTLELQLYIGIAAFLSIKKSVILMIVKQTSTGEKWGLGYFLFFGKQENILKAFFFCGSLAINTMEFHLRMTDSILFYKHKKPPELRTVCVRVRRNQRRVFSLVRKGCRFLTVFFSCVEILS